MHKELYDKKGTKKYENNRRGKGMTETGQGISAKDVVWNEKIWGNWR